jgi:type VI secretion system protein ImpA
MPVANIEALLAPVSADDPFGKDLEYGDPAFNAFERATQGKPEQQIGSTITPAEEPDWKAVGRQAIELLGRTKDLRVAVHLTKALLHTDGLRGLADGLTVLQRFIETYWEGLHPRLDPDDGNDPTMRVNILSILGAPDVLSAARSATIISSRTVGRFSYRDVEASAESMATIEAAGMDCDLADLEAQTSAAQGCTASLKTVESRVAALVGAEVAPAFGALTTLLQKIATFLQATLARRVPTGAGQEPASAGGVAGTSAGGGSATGEIRSRDDVVRALDRISAYYAKNEPSSPIPLLVDRCKRLVMMSFLDIIRELAPDGVQQIETLSGQKQG